MHGFVGKLYQRMVEIDQRMRGKGYPSSVAPYDPKKELAEATQMIQNRFRILKIHFTPPESKSPALRVGYQQRVIVWISEHYEWLIAGVTVPVLLWLFGG
jgi:hypothetical protein